MNEFVFWLLNFNPTKALTKLYVLGTPPLCASLKLSEMTAVMNNLYLKFEWWFVIDLIGWIRNCPLDLTHRFSKYFFA